MNVLLNEHVTLLLLTEGSLLKPRLISLVNFTWEGIGVMLNQDVDRPLLLAGKGCRL